MDRGGHQQWRRFDMSNPLVWFVFFVLAGVVLAFLVQAPSSDDDDAARDASTSVPEFSSTTSTPTLTTTSTPAVTTTSLAPSGAVDPCIAVELLGEYAGLSFKETKSKAVGETEATVSLLQDGSGCRAQIEFKWYALEDDDEDSAPDGYESGLQGTAAVADLGSWPTLEGSYFNNGEEFLDFQVQVLQLSGDTLLACYGIEPDVISSIAISRTGGVGLSQPHCPNE